MTHQRWTQNILERGVVVLGMLMLSACGSQHAGSVTAPSSVPESGSLTNVSGVQTRGTSESLTVSADVTVTTLVSGTTCPTLQFMVNTYVFKTSASTQYVNGACASVRAGTRLTASGTRPNSNDLLVYVSKAILKTETTPPAAPTSGGPVTTSGVVTSLAGGFRCPEQQFMFGTYAFRTAASTKYSGGGCADLKVGAKVELAGSYNSSDGFVRLTLVSFATGGTSPSSTAPTPAPGDSATPIEMEGVVSALVAGSTCPYLQFTLGSGVFVASRVTHDDGGSCDDVRPGTKVTVTGTRREGAAAVGVSTVVIKHETSTAPEPEDATVSGESVVTDVVAGTRCPALTFKVGPYSLTLTESTQFDAGSCSGITVGSTIEFTGLKQSDESIAVLRLSVR